MGCCGVLWGAVGRCGVLQLSSLCWHPCKVKKETQRPTAPRTQHNTTPTFPSPAPSSATEQREELGWWGTLGGGPGDGAELRSSAVSTACFGGDPIRDPIRDGIPRERAVPAGGRCSGLNHSIASAPAASSPSLPPPVGRRPTAATHAAQSGSCTHPGGGVVGGGGGGGAFCEAPLLCVGQNEL